MDVNWVKKVRACCERKPSQIRYQVDTGQTQRNMEAVVLGQRRIDTRK